MSELLRELQEDMQRERWAAIWKQYGRIVIGACVAAVFGTAAGVTYQHWRAEQNREQTARLIEALELARQGKTNVAHTHFAEIERDASGHSRPLVVLHHADSLRAVSKQDDLAALLKDADNRKGDALYVALVKAQALAAGEADSGAVTLTSPFGYTLAELQAWQAVRDGKSADAAKIFADLANAEEVPASLRERARLAKAMFEEQSEKSDEKQK